ncbi:MAG: hypothetical protein D6731_21655 [Planctomycetota bacterium]|nr:MAG: hypothetical protein D6731_21655 [Planctomycetota bacterium]
MFGEFGKTCEAFASRWWDGALRDPGLLRGVGRLLDASSAAKERSDRALEDHWNRWRLPSAADLERVLERLGDVEQRLSRLEARLGASEDARAEPR